MSAVVARRSLKAALIGAVPQGLDRLLADVLEDVGLTLEIVERPEEADVAFPLVTRDDVVATICHLKQRGIRRILALLSVRDDRVARRALDAGANVCYALDGPVDRLSFLVLTLLANSTPAAKPADLFRLGARVREVLQELRVFAARQREPAYRISTEAEDRLQSAIRADYGRARPRPFRLGINGRLETTLMRLDYLAVERIERAIQADIESELGRAD
ncbi:MAG TPA: hypothetical protein VGL86_33605 [Polyangia bacterium]|jgi:hypothetical protein